MALALSTLYHDESLLVVDKPAGLLVHNGWARERVTALSLAREVAAKHVYPLHRLDRATSGVLVFALAPEVARAAQGRLRAPETRKGYLALVRGVPSEAGVVDHPLAKEGSTERRPARTEFERWGTFERYSLVRLLLLTGRQHQARRHMKHLSHPLVGDVKYGKGEHNRAMRARFGLFRLALHAFELAWYHPITGEPLLHRAPLPRDLAEPLRGMGLLGLAKAAMESPPRRSSNLGGPASGSGHDRAPANLDDATVDSP